MCNLRVIIIYVYSIFIKKTLKNIKFSLIITIIIIFWLFSSMNKWRPNDWTIDPSIELVIWWPMTYPSQWSDRLCNYGHKWVKKQILVRNIKLASWLLPIWVGQAKSHFNKKSSVPPHSFVEDEPFDSPHLTLGTSTELWPVWVQFKGGIA